MSRHDHMSAIGDVRSVAKAEDDDVVAKIRVRRMARYFVSRFLDFRILHSHRIHARTRRNLGYSPTSPLGLRLRVFWNYFRVDIRMICCWRSVREIRPIAIRFRPLWCERSSLSASRNRTYNTTVRTTRMGRVFVKSEKKTRLI